jgi:hypothetical protein
MVLWTNLNNIIKLEKKKPLDGDDESFFKCWPTQGLGEHHKIHGS